MKITSALISALSLIAAPAAFAINEGDTFPKDVSLQYGFPPETINLGDRLAGKKVLVIGLPGAFTPTWSTRQVPGYLEKEDSFKKKLGIDEILIYCVNDGAVMGAWSADQGVPDDSIVKLMADPYGDVTGELDMELTHAGPKSVGLINRCKRFALYVVDGVVQIVRVAEAEDDPAGDDRPDITLAGAMFDAIGKLNKEGSDEL